MYYNTLITHYPFGTFRQAYWSLSGVKLIRTFFGVLLIDSCNPNEMFVVVSVHLHLCIVIETASVSLSLDPYFMHFKQKLNQNTCSIIKGRGINLKYSPFNLLRTLKYSEGLKLFRPNGLWKMHNIKI